MSVWSGWQKQLLQVAAVPTSSDNTTFLTDWHQHATTGCHNNPVDISLNISGASACKVTSNRQRTARNFASHDQAAGQFAAQLRSGAFSHLLAALESGNPYTPAGSDRVSADLVEWGSSAFATRYGKEVNVVIASGAPTGIHKGWEDMRRTVNRRVPGALSSSDKQIAAALRALSHARKVGF